LSFPQCCAVCEDCCEPRREHRGLVYLGKSLDGGADQEIGEGGEVSAGRSLPGLKSSSLLSNLPGATSLYVVTLFLFVHFFNGTGTESPGFWIAGEGSREEELSHQGPSLSVSLPRGEKDRDQRDIRDLRDFLKVASAPVTGQY